MNKGIVIAAATLAVATALGASGCASCSRMTKSIRSDATGGLDRTVTLYDYQGNVINSRSGKFDVTEDDNEIYFDDAQDKRVIIQGGIVVCEEN